MIVVDASALVVTLLDGGDRGERSRRLLAEDYADRPWFAPEHLIIEVASALRGLGLGGKADPDDLSAARDALAELAVNVVPTQLLLPRILELADNVTAYDAAYVACAEHLEVPLVTADQKLVAAFGPRCAFVEV